MCSSDLARSYGRHGRDRSNRSAGSHRRYGRNRGHRRHRPSRSADLVRRDIFEQHHLQHRHRRLLQRFGVHLARQFEYEQHAEFISDAVGTARSARRHRINRSYGCNRANGRCRCDGCARTHRRNRGYGCNGCDRSCRSRHLLDDIDRRRTALWDELFQPDQAVGRRW